MPAWARGTAFEDITGIKVSELSDDALYRNLDRLYPMREVIESKPRVRELSLFKLENTVYLYDLTSTYFEGSRWHDKSASASNIGIRARTKVMGTAGQPCSGMGLRTRV